MSDKTRKDILNKLLLRTQNKSRLWAALVALCVGSTMLLVSVLIWWNFRELLYGNNENESIASTYLIVGKKVTDQNMGMANATIFTPAEIDELKHAPQVQDVGVISSNHFSVYASMGGKLAFATDMPLECVPDKFIDNMPDAWKWEPGNPNLPIIVSSQFLDIYNYVFAPSQGLPQLSQSSVKNIALNLEVGSDGNKERFTAHVVGFSDRIGSVLAPKSFIDYGNQKFGRPGSTDAVSQLIIKAKDPSDLKFTGYLKAHDYSTNSENLRWSRIRSVVEVVTSATGLLALLLMGIGTLVFILFIELTIAHARSSLTLLLEIGYSPKYLSGFMIARFMPMVIVTILLSMGITCAVQVAASIAIKAEGLSLAPLPGWPVWVALLINLALLAVLISRSISKAINK